ncbi:MAG TPA: molybdopterin cofactor-binding domain-containing protein, partial [Acetobacteraceae bacterium]
MATLQSRSVRRREDVRLLTGKGNYSADPHPPGLLHAVLVRSPQAHAAIGRIDVSAAAAMPGVVAVFTAGDLTDVGPIPGGIGFPRPDGGPAPKTDRPLLAAGRVRFVGEPVAVVLAETAGAGKDAAEAVLVDYRELPLVTDPVAALRTDSPKVWDELPDNIGFLWKRGDADAADAALRGSAHVARLQFSVSRVTAASMEPRAAWAAIETDGRVMVHASHQSPYNLRNGMANGNFNIKPTDLRVLTADVGGSFGMKSGVQPEYALVAWAARRLRRPVRWVEDRTEAFLTDEQAREMRITVELGLDAQNRFTALKLRWDVNLGAYVTARSGWCVGNIGGTAGVYQIPTIYAESCGIMTNTMPTAAYRGAGRPEATYTIERIIDVAARERGISPYELRRINLIPPDAMPYKTALTFTYDSGEFEGNMQKAAEMAEFAAFDARRSEARARGKLR